MKITIELAGALELAALESALEMYECWAQEVIADPKAMASDGRTPERTVAEARAGIALLARVRGSK